MVGRKEAIGRSNRKNREIIGELAPFAPFLPTSRMDKHSSLATAEDLLLDSTNGPDQTAAPPSRTLYSIALTLSPPSTSTSTPSSSSSSLPPSSNSAPPPPTTTTISLLDQLEPDKKPLETSSSSNEAAPVSEGEGGARFGPVSIDWVDFMPPPNDDDEESKTPTGRSDLPDPFISSDAHPPKDSLILRSGSTSLPSGTVHLYRHAYPSSLNTSTSKPTTSTTSTYTTASVTLDHQSPPSTSSANLPMSSSPLSPSSSAHPSLPPTTSSSSSLETQDDGRLAAVLAVPSYFTPADFLAYVGRAEGEMEALRMIRDVSPSRSLVLIRFRSREAAEEFIEEFDGRLFNSFEVSESGQFYEEERRRAGRRVSRLSLCFVRRARSRSHIPVQLNPSCFFFFLTRQPEQCHVVRIKHVLAHFVPPSSSSNSSSPTIATTDTPPAPVETSPFPEDQTMMEALDGAFELPSCPVCLERLDSEISGLGESVVLSFFQRVLMLVTDSLISSSHVALFGMLFLVTVQCDHRFHCQCLARWTDSRFVASTSFGFFAS